MERLVKVDVAERNSLGHDATNGSVLSRQAVNGSACPKNCGRTAGLDICVSLVGAWLDV